MQGWLPVAADVQKLCSIAIEKADEWLWSNGQSETKQIDTLPAACRFRFEYITASSLVLVLKEVVSLQYHAIKGYKLWYWNSRGPPSTGEPAVFPKDQRKIIRVGNFGGLLLVAWLLPLTDKAMAT